LDTLKFWLLDASSNVQVMLPASLGVKVAPAAGEENPGKVIVAPLFAVLM
jgi:hypothetical protein